MTDAENSVGGSERCDRCDEPHDHLQDGLDGEMVCPPCIKKEAERHRERRRRAHGKGRLKL